jgi:hypothetical protein
MHEITGSEAMDPSNLFGVRLYQRQMRVPQYLNRANYPWFYTINIRLSKK